MTMQHKSDLKKAEKLSFEATVNLFYVTLNFMLMKSHFRRKRN